MKNVIFIFVFGFGFGSMHLNAWAQHVGPPPTTQPAAQPVRDLSHYPLGIVSRGHQDPDDPAVLKELDEYLKREDRTPKSDRAWVEKFEMPKIKGKYFKEKENPEDYKHTNLEYLHYFVFFMARGMYTSYGISREDSLQAVKACYMMYCTLIELTPELAKDPEMGPYNVSCAEDHGAAMQRCVSRDVRQHTSEPWRKANDYRFLDPEKYVDQQDFLICKKNRMDNRIRLNEKYEQVRALYVKEGAIAREAINNAKWEYIKQFNTYQNMETQCARKEGYDFSDPDEPRLEQLNAILTDDPVSLLMFIKKKEGVDPILETKPNAIRSLVDNLLKGIDSTHAKRKVLINFSQALYGQAMIDALQAALPKEQRKFGYFDPAAGKYAGTAAGYLLNRMFKDFEGDLAVLDIPKKQALESQKTVTLFMFSALQAASRATIANAGGFVVGFALANIGSGFDRQIRDYYDGKIRAVDEERARLTREEVAANFNLMKTHSAVMATSYARILAEQIPEIPEERLDLIMSNMSVDLLKLLDPPQAILQSDPALTGAPMSPMKKTGETGVVKTLKAKLVVPQIAPLTVGAKGTVSFTDEVMRHVMGAHAAQKIREGTP